MPTADELKNKFQQIREAVIAKLPDIALTLAITGKALAERNIKDKGFTAKYSTNKVPAWFFLGKELNGSGKAFLEGLGNDKKKPKGATKKLEDITEADFIDGETNWGEFREAQGLQSAFVDLSYTNQMWADMQPVEVRQESDGRVVAYLGARTKENQDKMNYNRDRYGDFISLGIGKGGREILTDVIVDEVNKVILQF